MMLLKSKWFWICAVLSIGIVIFLGVAFHRASHPQEVIKVYRTVELPTRKTVRPRATTAVSEQTPAALASEVDTTNTPFVDFSDDEADTMDTFKHSSDDFLVDEPMDAADALVSEVNTDIEYVDTEYVEYIAEQLAELHIKIPQILQRRIDLWEQVEVLSESHARNGEEPSPLVEQLMEERRELTSTVAGMIHDYLRYTGEDVSPFRPGGEFYDLMQQSGMAVGDGSE